MLESGVSGIKSFNIDQRVIEDLKKRSYVGIVFYLVVLYIVFYSGDYYRHYPEFSKLMTVAVCGICFFRFLHPPIAKHLEPRFVSINNVIFLISVLITSLIWGAGFARFMIQDGLADANLLMVMCTIGLSAGAAVAFYPLYRLSLVFSFFMLGPAIVFMVIYSMDKVLITSFILMLVYLAFMAYRGNREYWDALKNECLLEQKSKDLEKISRVDGLTGLFNRRYFDEVFDFELNRSIRKKQPISIILADIDNFKQVNDRYGHLAGDEYLKEVSRLFREVFKRKVDLIARYGGEEFIVLMPGEPAQIAGELAEDMRMKIQGHVLEYEGAQIKTTLSMGISSCIPQQDQTGQSLISKADEALYQSKTNGRNRVTLQD